MTTKRTAAMLVVLVMTVAGCGGTSARAEKADAAAADYATALSTYSRRLGNAVDAWKPVRTPEGDVKTWPSLQAQLVEPPTLDEVGGGEEASETYAAAAEVADRFDAIHAELGALESADQKLNNRRLDLYEMYIVYWQKVLQNNNQLYGATYDALYGGQAPEAERDQRLAQAYLRHERRHRAILQEYREDVPGLRLPGEMGESQMAYLQEELDFGIALTNEFVAYLRQRDPTVAQVTLYSDRLARYRLPAEGSMVRLLQLRGDLTHELTEDVAELARQARAGSAAADGPFVGDAYREVLLRVAARRTRPEDTWLATQAWLLHRIRELEGTPGEVYRRARDTIFLQANKDDPRDYYFLLLEVFSTYQSVLATDEPGEYDALRDWTLDQLARPAPPMLDQTRLAFREEVEQRSSPSISLPDDVEPVLRSAARALDDRRQMLAAVRESVAATSPGETRVR